MPFTLAPDWIYLDGRLQSGLSLSVDAGRITAVGPADPDAVKLPGQLLLPGFINAHSHSFQRAIRGGTEFRRPENPSDDFWSWRELMYQAALGLSPEGLEAVSRLLFVEMLEAGITTVGEFHYLHHQSDGRPYVDPDELAWRVIQAARWAGLKIVLLRVAYHRSGFGQSPNPRQIRFLDESADHVLQACERLREAGQAVGVAPHSVRAVPAGWFEPLRDYAERHNLPLHMHVSEQPREIVECQGEHRLRPVQLLHERGLLARNFTGIHLIHLESSEIDLLAQSASMVCSCPTTERNLGDGIVPADALLTRGIRICLGSDSQCQIGPLEDARQLEYHLRLQQRQRAILDPMRGRSLSATLLDCATSSGATSLGQNSGALEVGRCADMLAVDLEHPALVGCQDPLAAVVFGLPREAIRQVWVDGEAVLQEGRHPLAREAAVHYAQVLKALLHAG